MREALGGALSSEGHRRGEALSWLQPGRPGRRGPGSAGSWVGVAPRRAAAVLRLLVSLEPPQCACTGVFRDAGRAFKAPAALGGFPGRCPVSRWRETERGRVDAGSPSRAA